MRSGIASSRPSWPQLSLLAGSALLGAGVISAAVISAAVISAAAGASQPSTFLSSLGASRQIASTVPANGDVNPYGIVVVPANLGKLVKGDVLISNFNDKANVQGTGNTIMEMSPKGAASTFASLGALPRSRSCPGGIGLTTALSILPGGWVVVGSLPAGASGSLPAVNPAGCLLVLNSEGAAVETWSGPNINGPWDMTEANTAGGAALFVSNALSRPAGEKSTPASGLCTIVRVEVSLAAGAPPKMTGTTVIGSGFLWKANKAAFVLAPTGEVLAPNGTLYVAETPTNHVTAITNALRRTTPVVDGSATLSSGGSLNAPLGMALAPNGDVIVINGNDGNAVEITPQGKQVTTKTLVSNGAGDLFGATIAPGGHQLLFVNDGTNALDTAAAG